MIEIMLITIPILVVISDELTNKERVGVTLPSNKNNRITYKRKYIMTTPEKKFYDMFINIIGNEYVVIPQVSLRSIIATHDTSYHGELYKYIDFGIFSKDDYKLLLLIEINDSRHYNDAKTIERDENVKQICNSAGYRLIKFRLDKPNEIWYVKKVLHDCLNIKEKKFCEECNIQSKVSSY